MDERPRESPAGEPEQPDTPRSRRYLLLLTLTALGVVYGDIGTSPLYAVRECFFGDHTVPVTHENILGVLSLIFWALVIIISIKYLGFILRADNRGEGGILALMSLVGSRRGKQAHLLLIFMGLFGAALLYGDGMITPAISVLSAVEGLEVATPTFQPYVIPIAVAILVALFFFQRRGTAGVGIVFGPITLLWFVVIAILGIAAIVHRPAVLAALLPHHAIGFFLHNGGRGFLVLGAVFLVVTGGEALYADMGHFGRSPIRLGWFGVALPALLLNYFGQGALLLANPEAAHNPFYRMVPVWGLYPLIGLATLATIIASQAVISGAFSLTMQAMQHGYTPRLAIEHTSAEEMGQIYIPRVNWILMLATIGLVLGFRSSSNLAAAYGVAVTTTMVITTVLFFFVARELWHWKLIYLVPLTIGFLIVDTAFFGSNIVKVSHGGWFPLVIAGAVFTVMTTWKRGREILAGRLLERLLDLPTFLASIQETPPTRVPGTAVYMTGAPDGTPPALLHSLKHFGVLHERVVLLTVLTEEVPRVPARQRIELEELGFGLSRLVAHYGYMEDPNIPRELRRARPGGLRFETLSTTFVLGRETILPTQRPGMAIWRERLFAVMSRNSQNATAFFRLPPNRVVELGAQIEL